MSALNDILQKISDISDDTPKCRLFEALCWYFLKHDKVYGASFSDIWLWRDWSDNEGKPDTGIDIVAKFRDKNTLCAVQCKFRYDDKTITKDEINSFLALSSKEIYSARILFTITGNFSLNASNALNGFVQHDKGKLIIACGTGKTFTSLKIAESYSGRGGLILVLAPSISLLNQSLLDWNYDHDENLPLISFAVCSDATVGQKDYPDEDMLAKLSGKSYSLTVIF